MHVPSDAVSIRSFILFRSQTVLILSCAANWLLKRHKSGNRPMNIYRKSLLKMRCVAKSSNSSRSLRSKKISSGRVQISSREGNTERVTFAPFNVNRENTHYWAQQKTVIRAWLHGLLFQDECYRETSRAWRHRLNQTILAMNYSDYWIFVVLLRSFFRVWKCPHTINLINVLPNGVDSGKVTVSETKGKFFNLKTCFFGY